MAEKKLLEHLSKGGKPDDINGAQHVAKFAEIVCNDKSTAGSLSDAGFDEKMTAEFYGRVIKELMPRPWMMVGTPLLVPTQWFMEPRRLDMFFYENLRLLDDLSSKETFELLIKEAILLAKATRDAHDKKYGKVSIRIEDKGGVPFAAGGCASMILAGIVLATLFGGAVKFIL